MEKFTEVAKDYFDNIVYAFDNNKCRDFTDSELNMLKISSRVSLCSRNSITEVQCIRVRTDNNYFVYKLDDEWYLVQELFSDRITYKYYKCDQIDGLISCLV